MTRVKETRPLSSRRAASARRASAEVSLRPERELRAITDRVLRIAKASGIPETEVHVDEVIDALTRFANKVTLIHRRDQFRASKIMLDRAQQNKKIQFLTDTVVEDVLDVSKKEVTGLKLRNPKTGKVWDFPASALFLGIGHIPNAKMFEGQLDSDQDGYLKTTNNVFTRVPGVFACGDVQDRRYRQAVTAAGSGCMAALEVEKFLEEQGH